MKKEEYIRRYGEKRYEKLLKQRREKYRKNSGEERESSKLWRLNNPEKVKANHQANNLERSRKGGKYYDQHLKYQLTGLRYERELVRWKHRRRYQAYKQIIAPDSQIHHEWIPETADYGGVALVEKDPHQYGNIDVIQILEGEITLLTEEEIKIGGK